MKRNENWKKKKHGKRGCKTKVFLVDIRCPRDRTKYTLHSFSLRTLICWMILVLCHLAFLCTYARLCFCAQLDENWCERALGLHRGVPRQPMGGCNAPIRARQHGGDALGSPPPNRPHTADAVACAGRFQPALKCDRKEWGPGVALLRTLSGRDAKTISLKGVLPP